MESFFLPRRGAFRRAFAGALAAAAVALGACSGDKGSPQGPDLPGNPGGNPTFTRAAFVVDVDTRNGQMKVTPPELTGPSASILALGGVKDGSPDYSLLTRDVINLQVSNFFSSPVGAVQANKIRVSFDVGVENKLSTVRLITSTLPEAPAGQSGLLLFPYSATAVTAAGGASVAEDNVVVITLPSGGIVAPSPDWNGNSVLDKPTFPFPAGNGGNPHSFFNDKSCSAVTDPSAASDCFRYETFGVLQPGVVSGTRRIGFDIDATVGQFRVFILAAADVEPATVQTGTVTGTITGDDGRGPLAGVEVTVQGRPPVITNALGVFSDAGVPAPSNRSILVTASTLPVFCRPPQSTGNLTPANGQVVAVTASGTSTQNYTVDCAPPPAQVGTVSGTLTRTGTGSQSLAGITVVVNPDASGPPNVTVSSTGGPATATYTANGVQVGAGAGAGSGAVTLSGIPGGCTAPAPGSYSGLTDGGSQTVSFSIQCDAPPARYVYRNSWGAISGGSVDLTIAFDPSGFNDPIINGAGPDGFAGYQGIVTLTGSAAGRFTAVSGVAVAPFATPTIGGTLPIVSYLANAAVADPGVTTLSNVGILRFTVGAGAAGSVTTSTTVQEISTPGGDAFSLTFTGPGQNIDVIEATLTVP